MTADTEQGIPEPKQDRIGNDYREGPNPNPGGNIDTGDSLVPPYEGRSGEAAPDSEVTTEAESLEARALGVRRQETGEDAPKEANTESLLGPTGGSPGEEPPKHTGESIGRRGEDQSKHSKEPGRYDTDGGDANRPKGKSTPRDRTGVNPQEGPN
jgi:hypothetical protein